MSVDWDEIGKIVSYLVPVIIFIAANGFFKKQKGPERQFAVVKSLLAEIDYNRKLLESFSLRRQIKKFRLTVWEKNKGRLDYLEAGGLHATMTAAYDITWEFNQQIAMARQYQSTSYLESLKADRLQKPLEQSQQGLQQWLEMNRNRPKATPAQT